MGANHRGALILVAQHFLESPDGIAICSPLKMYSGTLEPSQIRTLPMILLSQIRSGDKRWLFKRLGRLTPEAMRKADQALLVSFGLVEL